MIERSQQPPQTSLIDDSARQCPLDRSPHREDQGSNPFLYANCCLGLFLMDPVDFHAFAKGQLIAMAIMVPAAIALFYIFGLATPSAGQIAMKLGNLP